MVEIRYAKRSDLPTILSFVKDLAVFEKEPNAVKATLEDYNQAYDSNLIGGIVAEIDDEMVGMALYYDTFSTWRGKMLNLEDFIVKEEYRNQKIGDKIFDAVVEEAKKRDCTMMKLQVLDWNTNAQRFYERKDMIIDKSWYDCKLYFRIN